MITKNKFELLVEKETREVLEKLKARGSLPDHIEINNEEGLLNSNMGSTGSYGKNFWIPFVVLK